MLEWIKTRKYILLVGGLLFVALSAFVVAYTASEKTIYTWDFANYWRPAIDLSHQIENEPKEALKTIINRTRTDEYNVLHATPPAVWMLIFGTGRMSYIISIYLLYFIPATLLMAAVAYKLFRPLLEKKSKKRQLWTGLAIWALIALNPIILTPILRGYPDIVGLGVLSLAVLIYIKHRTNIKMRWLFAMAGLFVLATLLRRWYIFGSVGLILGIGIDQLVLIIKSTPAWKYRLLKIAKLCTLPFTYLGLFLLIAWPYVQHLLTTNYSANYSAYQRHHDYFELGWFTIQHFSAPLLILALVSFGWMIWKRQQRGIVTVLFISVVFSFFAVGRVQSFDAHQYYLLTLPFVIGVALSPFIITKMVREGWARTVFISVIGAIAILFAINSVSIYRSTINAVPIVSKLNVKPMIRTDLNEIKQMYQFVASLGDDKKIYVLPCSEIFNIDTFRNVPLSVSVSEPINYDNYLFTSQLDTRDGFNTGFFDADVVIDTNPPGYIAKLDEQQIVTYLHQQITNGILSPYYTKAYSYTVEEYSAAVYIRKAAIPDSVQKILLDKISSTHENVRIFLASSPYG